MTSRSSALPMTAGAGRVTVEPMERLRELWSNDRGRLVHYLVAVSLAIYLVVETAMSDATTGWQLALAAVAAVALLFSRDVPFAAPLVVAAALAGVVAIDADAVYDMDAPFLIMLFMPWSLGSYNDRTKAIVGLVWYQLVALLVSIEFRNSGADYFWIGIFISVAWASGFILSRRSEHLHVMAERARQAERDQAAAAERAVAEERQRIARELHDVIAHSVSVMTVQAGAVRRLLKPEQEKERAALEAVESTGREALTEMRRLVGLLREQGAMPEFAPQPGMGTIDELLDGVRAAGLPVELEVAGAPRELPPGVDLAAYRVVQEALTNALKYAGPAHAWVAVTWHDDELELEIANDGKGDGDGSGGGHGLAGMRERVSAVRRRHRERRAVRRRLRGPRSAPAGGGRAVIRVLIVDDQSLVRAGFRMILEAESDIEVVGEAADGADALTAVRESEPDVILMDVRMPNVDGLEATRRLLDGKAEGPRVLILTTFDLDEYVYEALRVGASGFLLKDTPPEQLVDAIHVVANGDALLSPVITRRVIEEFVRRPPDSVRKPSPALEELTARELEILRFIARGLSNAEIAKAAFVSETTVKTHVAHVLMKLRLRDRVQAVVFAYENGVVAPGETE